MAKIRLIYASFPDVANALGGVAIHDHAGYGIMINKNKTVAEQTRALKHELSHIILGHLTDDRTDTTEVYFDNLDDVEREADEYADTITDETLAELLDGLIGETVYL